MTNRNVKIYPFLWFFFRIKQILSCLQIPEQSKYIPTSLFMCASTKRTFWKMETSFSIPKILNMYNISRTKFTSFSALMWSQRFMLLHSALLWGFIVQEACPSKCLEFLFLCLITLTHGRKLRLPSCYLVLRAELCGGRMQNCRYSPWQYSVYPLSMDFWLANHVACEWTLNPQRFDF